MPAYVEQMFDRLEASGIILGWDRNDWEIWTTQIGLDIRIEPRSVRELDPSSRGAVGALRWSRTSRGALIRSAAVLAAGVSGRILDDSPVVLEGRGRSSGLFEVLAQLEKMRRRCRRRLFRSAAWSTVFLVVVSAGGRGPGRGSLAVPALAGSGRLAIRRRRWRTRPRSGSPWPRRLAALGLPAWRPRIRLAFLMYFSGFSLNSSRQPVQQIGKRAALVARWSWWRRRP